MKNALKLFVFAFIVAAAFPAMSCHRSAPAPAAFETLYTNNANGEQEATIDLVSENNYGINNLPQDISSFPANEITRFTPLQDNEQFAVSYLNMRSQVGNPAILRDWQRLVIFAMRNNDIEDISELFTWDHFQGPTFQFTRDFQRVFFMDRNWNADISPSPIRNLFMADGRAGEIRRLLTDTEIVRHTGWRVSKDGRFVSFAEHVPSRAYVLRLVLFDVESKAIVGEFEWQPTSERALINIQGWTIRRFGDIFRMLGVSEIGSIDAVVEFDPVTMEFTMLWDDFALSGLSSRAFEHERAWADDTFYMNWVAPARLQR
jgi:hypothetical protein